MAPVAYLSQSGTIEERGRTDRTFKQILRLAAALFNPPANERPLPAFVSVLSRHIVQPQDSILACRCQFVSSFALVTRLSHPDLSHLSLFALPPSDA